MYFWVAKVNICTKLQVMYLILSGRLHEKLGAHERASVSMKEVLGWWEDVDGTAGGGGRERNTPKGWVQQRFSKNVELRALHIFVRWYLAQSQSHMIATTSPSTSLPLAEFWDHNFFFGRRCCMTKSCRTHSQLYLTSLPTLLTLKVILTQALSPHTHLYLVFSLTLSPSLTLSLIRSSRWRCTIT
jgi:hypothetical protein